MSVFLEYIYWRSVALTYRETRRYNTRFCSISRFQKFYLPTARQVKRMESVLRSPIYNHFSETITGASVIRAYKCVDRFVEESERRVDKNAKFFFAAISGAR